VIRRLPLVVSAVALFALSLRADSLAIYAIRGARIVTVSSATIGNGTVVMRDGRIAAVGASPAIPPEATVIEGAGLTVYPGLIDLGNTGAVDPGPAVPSPQGSRTTAQVERWKRTQLLKPQVRAADLVKVDDAELAKLAANGITTVLALPPGDVVSGQSALVSVAAPPDSPQIGNLAGGRRSLVVMKAPVALHVSFPSRPRVGTNSYPVSLMGVLAFVRQAFVDAQYYALQETHHQAPDDPALAAMQPALQKKLPVAFEANTSREILRALAMAREFGLDPIVTGGREAGSVIDDLKAQAARVIVSANFPQRSRALAPDADEPLRDLEARANAADAPAALAKAGVLYGFASAGLSDTRDFRRNAAKAVARGLPADAAVRALTLDAARIAGAADRLGSIEVNKAATLIVTDGNLLDEKTAIVRVFINGQPIPIEASTPVSPRRP
jgi:imidazolonepropionase-like amidohydrolase